MNRCGCGNGASNQSAGGSGHPARIDASVETTCPISLQAAAGHPARIDAGVETTCPISLQAGAGIRHESMRVRKRRVQSICRRQQSIHLHEKNIRSPIEKLKNAVLFVTRSMRRATDGSKKRRCIFRFRRGGREFFEEDDACAAHSCAALPRRPLLRCALPRRPLC